MGVLRLLSVLSFVCACGVSHADPAYESFVRAEFSRLAAYLGVRAPLSIEALRSDTYSQPNGPIVFGMATLDGLQVEAKKQTTKFYLAHELWHQIQYQRYKYDPFASSSEMKRLYECQADLMAAEIITATDPPTVALQSVKTITNLAHSIGAPSHLGGEHPPPEQRRTATRYGITAALTEPVFFSLWERELKERTADFISGLRRDIGLREGMDVADWALTQCKMVTHYSASALAAISVERPTINFNKDPNAPFVAYRVPYKNTSSRPVRLSVAIQSVMVSREDPKELSKIISFAMRQYVVDISPGQSYEVAGTLPWFGDDVYSPELEFKTNTPRSLISAEFIGPSTEANSCITVRLDGLPPFPKSLATTFHKFAADVDLGFASFWAGPSSPTSDSAIYDSTLQVPGARTTEIELEKGGAARVTAELYYGKDVKQATTVYNRFKTAFEAICPAGTPFRESNRKPGPDLTFPFSRRTTIHLFVYTNTERGTSRVTLDLDVVRW